MKKDHKRGPHDDSPEVNPGHLSHHGHHGHPGQSDAGPGPGAAPEGQAPSPEAELGDIELNAGATASERALHDELEQMRGELDEYVDVARRARADYVNLERRVQSQAGAVRMEAQAEFARDMLDVLDDLDRALSHVSEAEESSPIVAGIKMVRDKFLAKLAQYDIRPVEALGKPFDPNIHQAVAQQPTNEVEPNTVVDVASPGYMAGARLLRPAHVVVSVPAAP